MFPESPACACGSGRDFAACCEPCLAGKAHAETALALMRSRYTAYCRGDTGYLLRTWHGETRPESFSLIGDGTRWLGLRIVRWEGGGAGEETGIVEFFADYEQSGRRQTLHEVSRFRRGAEGWLYLDGEVAAERVPRFKQARNEPCACGSGRKFKKCCGSNGT